MDFSTFQCSFLYKNYSFFHMNRLGGYIFEIPNLTTSDKEEEKNLRVARNVDGIRLIRRFVIDRAISILYFR